MSTWLRLVAAVALLCGCATHATLKGTRATGSTESPTPADAVRLLPRGVYDGEVVRIDVAAHEMTFRITSSCGSASSGVWLVPLDKATFWVNDEPQTAMGRTDQVGLRDWVQAASAWKTWHVDSAHGGVDITDGPTTGCAGP